MKDTFDIKDTKENSMQKNDNNSLKIVPLIILVFAAQLSAMFIYERYMQRSKIEKMHDKQRALRLLHKKYSKKNILSEKRIKTSINASNLNFWKDVDTCHPENGYQELIDQMEKDKRFRSTDKKSAIESEIEKAKAHKKELIKLFEEFISILKS